MNLRNMAVLLLVFVIAAFAIPLTAFVGTERVLVPADVSAPPQPTPDEPEPSAQWPYGGSSDPGGGETEGGAESPEEPVTVLTTALGREFTYYDMGDGEIKTISAEDYVRGALAAEMPASFHMEALKAQAVSAHTYALYCAEAAGQAGADYDFTANPANCEGFITADQAGDFFGSQYDYYWGRICEAADTALDYVMVYEGEPILAAYHASSVGITEAAENVWPNPVPYLVPVDSAGDSLSPGYSTTVSMSTSAVKEALTAAFGDIRLSSRPQSWIEPLEYSPSGYITLVRVGDTEVHGSELRFALGLRSTAIAMDYAADVFTFTTTGYGHGVGLSQYGADYMALQGSTFDEILTHYYPGATLAMLAYAN